LSFCVLHRSRGQDVPVTSVCSPGTSYWCVSENADSPFLLSPIPGPSTKDPPPSKHTPGRDHRRYYHEYWRSEYLMDFDPQRQGMICMVCGSSLATLKLSTIKRHINQKHPYSLLWTESDKDVIRSGWESHLNRENSQPLCPEINIHGSASFIPLNVDPIQENLMNYTRGDENPPDTGQRSQSLPYYPRKRRLKYGSPWRLRLDYLVAYGPPENPLCYCMVCSEHLPVPRVSNFRKHIQECHPEMSSLSRSERDAVVSAWIKEEKIDKATPKEDGKSSNQSSNFVSHKKSLKPDQLNPRSKIDNLNPVEKTSICWLGIWSFAGLKKSSYKSNISFKNNNVSLSFLLFATEDPQSGPVTTNAAGGMQVSPVKSTEQGVETEDNNSTNITPSTQMPGRHRHYPGKDQRRNYQARWKMDFLMDYDCRKHGLICMVCGATLATLKVSTIKRHILQVHPHSLDYNPEERQLVLLCYNQISPSHLVFKSPKQKECDLRQPFSERNTGKKKQQTCQGTRIK
uniref:Si:dkey-106g10.7 n=1 Tax=Sinocyclocheilus grahami TaxID=75366 RepID=A0A672QHI8_SINGR